MSSLPHSAAAWGVRGGVDLVKGGANECVGGRTGGWTGTVEPINILMPIRNLQDHLRQFMMHGN
jgi:hypothetical protein